MTAAPPPKPNPHAGWSISIRDTYGTHTDPGTALPRLNSEQWRRKVTVGVPLPRGKTVVLQIEQPSREFIYFGLFLISLQIADGILTSIGIRRFGIGGEGNPMLRYAMRYVTPEQAMLAGKLAAILIVIGLTVVARRVRAVRDLIGVLSCIYLFAAIIPWIYCLYVAQ